MTHRFPTILALSALGLAAACARRQPPAPPPVSSTAPTPTDDRAPRDSLARVAAMRDSAERAERDRAARAAARAKLEAPVYFDFDRSEIVSPSRITLDGKLDVLSAYPSVRLLISGHADERGSDEYNLALGQRRAAAAKRYLVQRGISENRLEIVSFGEERPVCTAGDESCWMRNRRAEFEIVSGADAMAVR